MELRHPILPCFSFSTNPDLQHGLTCCFAGATGHTEKFASKVEVELFSPYFVAQNGVGFVDFLSLGRRHRTRGKKEDASINKTMPPMSGYAIP